VSNPLHHHTVLNAYRSGDSVILGIVPICSMLQTMERYLSAVVSVSLSVLSVTKVCCVVLSRSVDSRFVPDFWFQFSVTSSFLSELFQVRLGTWIIAIKHTTTPPPQPFYSPFSGTTRVSRCQKRTSGLYGAREH